VSPGPTSPELRETFADLVQPLLDSLYRTAFRMAGDRQVAEELVQETCLRAYARFDQYEDGSNFKAWLFRILSNLCIDHLRRRAGASFVPLETLPEPVCSATLAVESATPEALAIGRDVEGAIAQALSVLGPELRMVVMLILVEEMSYAEAAESLDLPVGTVRSRLHRARAELQGKLGVLLDRRPVKAKKRDMSGVITLFA